MIGYIIALIATLIGLVIWILTDKSWDIREDDGRN